MCPTEMLNHMCSTKIEAKEDYILPYIDYDNDPQDRDDVELTFHTEVYAAAIRMADNTEQ